MIGESERKRCCYLVQNWVILVNKELIFPIFSIKFVKFGFKLEENNDKYIFGILKLFCLYSRSDKTELVQPFSNDSFQRTISTHK